MLLGINRSTIYYKNVPESRLNQELKLHIASIWVEHNNKGSRSIVADLRVYYALIVNRKRIMRLMGILGIAGILPKKSQKPADARYKYPYMLSGMHIYKPNLVWVIDITYCKLSSGTMYVVCILDVFSRKVLAHEISNTLDTSSCIQLWHATVFR